MKEKTKKILGVCVLMIYLSYSKPYILVGGSHLRATSPTLEAVYLSKAVETTEEINVDNGVDGRDDINQGNTHKALETTEEINVDNCIRSDIVIDNELPFLEGSEGHEENAGLGNLRGLVETEQTEALVRGAKIFEERDYTRSPRYFDFPTRSWQMCYNCGKNDHNAVECTMERKKKPYYICGGLEHSAKRCKQLT